MYKYNKKYNCLLFIIIVVVDIIIYFIYIRLAIHKNSILNSNEINKKL
jgi:hypothetical protein